MTQREGFEDFWNSFMDEMKRKDPVLYRLVENGVTLEEFGQLYNSNRDVKRAIDSSARRQEWARLGELALKIGQRHGLWNDFKGEFVRSAGRKAGSTAMSILGYMIAAHLGLPVPDFKLL